MVDNHIKYIQLNLKLILLDFPIKDINHKYEY